MTHLLNFLPPTALDVVLSPWENFVFMLPALLIIGALVAVVVTITVLLIRRFFGKKK